MTPDLREACRHAMHVVRADRTILKGGRAAIHILDGLGWRSARLLRIPPLVWCVELGYRIVARHRRFFSKFLFRT